MIMGREFKEGFEEARRKAGNVYVCYDGRKVRVIAYRTRKGVLQAQSLATGEWHAVDRSAVLEIAI